MNVFYRGVVLCVVLAISPASFDRVYPQAILPITGDDIEVDVYDRIVILDGARNTLRLFGPDGELLREVGGSGWGDNQFDSPKAVWARNGIDVFVADYGNHRIQRFDRNLNFVASFSTHGAEDEKVRFGYPGGVALSRQGDLFLADGENVRIVSVGGFSTIKRVFGGFDAGKGRTLAPSVVDVGPKDNVYVCDGKRVLVFDAFGSFVQNIGMFASDVRVVADLRGVVVVSNDSVVVYDETNRRLGSVSSSSMLSGPLRITDMAFANGKAYVLTAEGIHIVPDPVEALLEREQKK